MLSKTGRILQLQNYAAVARYASLHLSYPGDTGAGEISGVTRQLLGWGAPGDDGIMTVAGTTNWSLPNASGVNWIGLWSAPSGGWFLGFLPWGGREQPFILVAGKVRAVAHGFAENAPIVFVGVRPSPLNEGVRYYAVGVTQDDFSVAATPNGTPIPLTAVDGDGFVSYFPGGSFAAGAVASASNISVSIDAGVVSIAPVLTLPAELPALPGDTLQVSQYVATPDNFPVTAYFVALGTLPAGMTLDGTTGALTTLPSAPFANTVVRFGVRDSRGLETISQDVTIRINGAPVWIDNDVTIQQGSSFSLGALCTDPDGGTISFATPNGLPAGFSRSGALVSTTQGVASGIYNIVFTASDGIAAPVAQTLVVTVNQLPVSTGSLTFTQSPRYADAVAVPNGTRWTKYEQDIREGIVGWGAGDHGEIGSTTPNSEPDSHSVRYFNTGSTDIVLGSKIMPAGVDSYLVDFGHSDFVGREPYAKVSDYDNYPQWIMPSEDKMFWTPSTDGIGGGRYGIFDFKVGDWTHGNNTINANQWPSGPLHSDYIEGVAGSGTAVTKNSPNATIEALETAVAISFGTNQAIFTIERNPNYPHASTKPWKKYGADGTNWIDGRSANLVRNHLYAPSIGDHNQFMNSGVEVGEWLYFIRPMSGADLANKFGSSTAPQREFWKVHMRRPFNRFKRLADFPDFVCLTEGTITQQGFAANKTEWHAMLIAGLMVYDEPSQSVIYLNNRLWVYDMRADTWTVRSPANFMRVLEAVGVLKRSTREIIYRGGLEADTTSTVPKWSKITISGAEVPRLKWTPVEMAMDYGRGTAGSVVPMGKHTRGVALHTFRKVDDGRQYTGAKRNLDGTLTDVIKQITNAGVQAESDGPYVMWYGGDRAGTPYTSASEVPGYPAHVSFSGGGDTTSRSTSGQITSGSTKYWGYRVATTITGVVTIYDARVVNSVVDYALDGQGQPIVIDTIPAGTVGGTRVNRTTGYIPAKGVYASFATLGGSVSAIMAAGWNWDSGRQDQWMTHVTEKDGKHQFELAQNHVAFYPYPGGPDPATTELGPGHPDGCGVCVDELTGDVWVGPGRYRFQKNSVPESGGSTSAAMYRWRMPGKHTNGVRKGNGYYKPPQQNEFPWTGVIGDNMWTAFDRIHRHVVHIYPVGNGPWKYVINRFDVREGSPTYCTWLTPVEINFGTGESSQEAIRYRDFAQALTRNGVVPQLNPSQLMGGPIQIYGEYAYVVVNAGHNTNSDGRVWFIAKFKLTGLSNSSKPEYIGHPAEAYWQRAWDKPTIAGINSPQSINQMRDMHRCGQLLVFSPPALEYVPSEDPWCYVYDVNRNKWWLSKTYNEMRQELVTAGVPAAQLPPADHNGPLGVAEDDDGAGVYQAGPYMARGRSVVVSSEWELWHLTSGEVVAGQNTKFGIVKMRLPVL